jgi:uncharacterized protein YwgA
MGDSRVSTSAQSQQEALIAPDLILLLLKAESPTPGRLDGVTRLEKLLYLLDRETEVPAEVTDSFAFLPYHYGPYSRQVYEAVDILEEAELIREEKVLEGNTLDEMEEAAMTDAEREGVERRFFLTDDGADVATLLAQKHQGIFQQVHDIKSQYGAMPLRQLIRYVYTRYPESAARSRIRDQVT